MPEQESGYTIRPKFSQKFWPATVKELIHNNLKEYFSDKPSYSSEDSSQWTKELTEQLKGKLIELGYERYKFVVQVVIGEQRGEGVKIGCRCFWDADTDNLAQDTYMNDSFFCQATAFGVYYY